MEQQERCVDEMVEYCIKNGLISTEKKYLEPSWHSEFFF